MADSPGRTNATAPTTLGRVERVLHPPLPPVVAPGMGQVDPIAHVGEQVDGEAVTFAQRMPIAEER